MIFVRSLMIFYFLFLQSSRNLKGEKSTDYRHRMMMTALKMLCWLKIHLAWNNYLTLFRFGDMHRRLMACSDSICVCVLWDEVIFSYFTRIFRLLPLLLSSVGLYFFLMQKSDGDSDGETSELSKSSGSEDENGLSESPMKIKSKKPSSRKRLRSISPDNKV